MRLVLSCEQMRAFDQHAARNCQVPSLVLMENAGRGAAEVVFEQPGLRRIAICCGPGNNGGDGYVVARRLRVLGLEVRVFSSAPLERVAGDARTMMDAYMGVGGTVETLDTEVSWRELETVLGRSDAVVDALLGTGLDREVKAPIRTVIEAINRSGARIYSLDLPSGLHADTGVVLGLAVRAHVTVTFAHPKLGSYTPSGLSHGGHLLVRDIGVPASLAEHSGHSAVLLERNDLVRLLREREPQVHKGDAGRVAVLAGSPGKLGAAHLVARGALRGGAGLVTMLNVDSVVATFEQRVTEVMTERLDETDLEGSLRRATENVDALAVGPGLGTDERGLKLVDAALTLPCTKVVDADALTLCASHPGLLGGLRGPAIFTPHPGEAARLLGTSVTDVERDRYAALDGLVKLTGSPVLLKGACTLVGAPDHLAHVNAFGSPVLATGGSGDVLTGLTAALAVGHDPFEAALLGAGIHGLSGLSWARRTGADRGMLASEIADEAPRVVAQLAKDRAPLTD